MDQRHQIRRAWLQQTACGFGALAASALCSPSIAKQPSFPVDSSGTISGTHHPAKAKRVIFLFMQGGVSHVDSFDYKPLLAERNGHSFEFNDARQLAKQGKATQQRLMVSPWKFKQYGESGRWASELFPETARHMDDLTMLHGMRTEGIAHGPATLFLHCGSTNFLRPSMGAWVLYGLGSENQDLPGFVSIAPSSGNGGPRNYGNAFLPAQVQGTRIGEASSDSLTVQNLIPRQDISASDRKQQIVALSRLNAEQLARRNFKSNELDAVIDSFEMAWRMQSTAPPILDLQQESKETIGLYGIDEPKTREYGRRCLLARRLCESGVRFIQVNYGDNSANPAWDQHSNIPKHADHAKAVDRPIAGLLADLKQRGLLEDTIVWWGGEFGRTPYAQDNGTGRDHNPVGFTVWVAGGGFKAGYSHGSTDDFGFQAIQGKVHMHDLHATILHQLGLDHKRLTFPHMGRDFRLTDVYGRVVNEIIA
jgi:Protein of unknown function (DUF1501)